MTMTDSRPSKPKLRWYQFSLPTLLLAVLVLGVFFGLLGSRMQRAKENRRAMAKLHRVESGPDRVSFLPDVDFVETKDDYRVFLSIPGLIEEDIDISLRGNILTVRGERQPPYDPERHRKRLGEWRYGFFERRIRFPRQVEPSAIKATYEAGVLTIVVSKSKE